MIAHNTRYGFGATLPLDYERAVERSREELAKEVRTRLERVLAAVAGG